MELLPHRPDTAMTAVSAAISVLLIYRRLARMSELAACGESVPRSGDTCSRVTTGTSRECPAKGGTAIGDGWAMMVPAWLLSLAARDKAQAHGGPGRVSCTMSSGTGIKGPDTSAGQLACQGEG